VTPPASHRCVEFPAEYSLASCSPSRARLRFLSRPQPATFNLRSSSKKATGGFSRCLSSRVHSIRAISVNSLHQGNSQAIFWLAKPIFANSAQNSRILVKNQGNLQGLLGICYLTSYFPLVCRPSFAWPNIEHRELPANPGLAWGLPVAHGNTAVRRSAASVKAEGLGGNSKVKRPPFASGLKTRGDA
jgi:hypothetical protein